MATPASNPPLPSPTSVGAVIVSWHPDAAAADRLRPLIGQVGGIVVVDNGSDEEELVPFRPLAADGVIELIVNDRNRGLAAALNQGLAWAESRGYGWALTLDQDTEPGPDVVSEGARVVRARPDERIAVIGAGIDDGGASMGDTTDRGSEVIAVITAGSLHSIAAWRALGTFREDFFVDCIDTEFCLRARSRGYTVVRSSRPTVRHAIGIPETHRTPFRAFTSTNHSPRRRYYITRNRILMWRSYARREPRYVARDVWVQAKDLIKAVAFEEDRGGKLSAALRGVGDAILGRTGEFGSTRRIKA